MDASTPFKIIAVVTTPQGYRVDVDVGGDVRTAWLDEIQNAADSATELSAFYQRVYKAAGDWIREAEVERSWFALVTFGQPSPDVPASFRVACGRAGLSRLRRLADECKGSGTCSEARVVSRASADEAREADISAGGVVYTA